MKIMATYGHGTENDFVIIFDPEETTAISPEVTAALCNRAMGIGADGLIRITRPKDKWFMDYRNADGSIAEMCGNGIRVMARYLVANDYQKEGIFPIDTRDGLKHLRVPSNGNITVNMGELTHENEEITVTVNGMTREGYNISIGNPHAVVFVESLDDLGNLRMAPEVLPPDAYPEGVNVEFVEFSEGHELKMRVFERGVGETKSCGTGTCAVALAATLKRGERLPAKWVIYPPGGRLEVEIDSHSNATLTGPAVLISEHDITRYFSQDHK
ncbi:MAG: diaminopimelate epimerase [Actinobacteria bacterium]|nr:diaminopimelate epimerase [Actinomycetota bacterium]